MQEIGSALYCFAKVWDQHKIGFWIFEEVEKIDLLLGFACDNQQATNNRAMYCNHPRDLHCVGDMFYDECTDCLWRVTQICTRECNHMYTINVDLELARDPQVKSWCYGRLRKASCCKWSWTLPDHRDHWW